MSNKREENRTKDCFAAEAGGLGSFRLLGGVGHVGSPHRPSMVALGSEEISFCSAELRKGRETRLENSFLLSSP